MPYPLLGDQVVDFIKQIIFIVRVKNGYRFIEDFVEVVRTRHFSKAAENLYITQSAVSFRIRQLEQGLGVNLFIRQRNNIQLTAPGERLLPRTNDHYRYAARKVDVALADNMLSKLA